AALAIFERQRHWNAVGDDLAGNDADRKRRRPLPSRNKISGLTPPRLDAVAPDRLKRSARGEQSFVHHPPPRHRHRDGTVFKIVDNDEIGAPAGRDKAAVPEPEDARGRNRGGAISGEGRRAKLDRGADEKVE